MTDVLATRSGGVHDRVVGYLDLIDSLCGTVEALKKERADALGALTMLDTGAPGSLADKVNELRALWATASTNGPRAHEQLRAALEAMLAWPDSEDPALGCEQATAQAKRALADAGASPGPCYTEKEIRQAVKYVSGRDSCDDTIDYLHHSRTST